MSFDDAKKLLTVEEYQHLADVDGHTELVRGHVVKSRFPGFRHGVVCANVGTQLDRFLNENDIGRAVNNTGVVTTRDPDSVRRADVAFYSYSRLPKDDCPEGYPEKPPELVFDVMWQDDRWATVLQRTAEFLSIGVNSVIVLDTDRGAAHVISTDEPHRILDGQDTLQLPDILPDFSMPVAKLIRR